MADTQLNLEADIATVRAVVFKSMPEVQHAFRRICTAASLAPSQSVSEGEITLPAGLCRDDTEHDVEYFTADMVREAILKARQYQRAVDEKIIARQDAELCRLRAATKAAAPAGASIAALARKLAEHYPRQISGLYVDDQPVGRELVEACRAPAGEDAREQGEPWAYAMVRDGKVEGIEGSKFGVSLWVNAEAVPLFPRRAHDMGIPASGEKAQAGEDA